MMRLALNVKARFTPFIGGKGDQGGQLEYVKETTGTVDYINARHSYFSVRYEAGEEVLHECFKLSQIGEDVKLLGRR